MKPLALVGLLALVSTGAQAQARATVRAGSATPDCRDCHTAVTPTKAAPALLACPRLKIKGYHAIDEAPPSLTLGSKGATYGAVTFAHRAHAHMAETGAGCSGCHHYDQARPIQKCKVCHAVARRREDLGKPDLKGAMHRQCIECHREWNPTGTCGTCHQKSGATATPAAKPVTPERIVYETGAKEGKTVTFFHKTHIDRFGLACAECHRQESCAGCHDRRKTGGDRSVLTRTTAAGLTDEQAHARCATCHARSECATCHKGMATPSIGFDHGRRTGFALNRFHAVLTCKQCHTAAGGYARLNPDCESCHKGWQAKFNHAKTGLALDEQHKDFDCSSCHEDKTFRAKPVCTGCHTDKAWPAQKPGQSAPKPKPQR